MTVEVFLGASATWASIVMAAVFVGLLGNSFLRDRFGGAAAHMLEVLMMIVMIYALTFLFVSAHQIASVRLLSGIGVAWVILALGLELLIGHFALGEPWARLRRFFKIKAGQLYSIVLLVLLVSPYIASLHVAAIQR